MRPHWNSIAEHPLTNDDGGTIMAVKLPEHLTKKQDIPGLKDMPIGATWFVNFTALVADKETRECFLYPDGKRTDDDDDEGPGISDIKVRRDDAGYHVIIPSNRHEEVPFKFRLVETANKQGFTIPVESIVEETKRQ
jgi:hypothetical protein